METVEATFTKRIDIVPVSGDNGLDAVGRAIEKASYFVRWRQNQERINRRVWWLKTYTVSCVEADDRNYIDVTVTFTDDEKFEPFTGKETRQT